MRIPMTYNNKNTVLIAVMLVPLFTLGITVGNSQLAYAGVVIDCSLVDAPTPTPSITPEMTTVTLSPGESSELFSKIFDMDDTHACWPVLSLYFDAQCSQEFNDNVELQYGTPDSGFDIGLTIKAKEAATPGDYHCESAGFLVQYGNVDANETIEIHANEKIWVTIEDSDPVTPVEKIEGLISHVGDLGLGHGNENALKKKLVNAIKNITNEDLTDDHEACEKLQSFVDQLNAFVNAGKLTQEQVDPLIDIATQCIWDLCLDTI